MLTRTSWAALVAALHFSSLGFAQQLPVPEKLLGTTHVTNEPTYGSGVVVGCGLSYKALIRDWKYRQGALSVVYGSFGAIKSNSNGTLGGYLKVVVLDLSINGGQLAETPNAPAFAYLLTNNGIGTSSDQVGGGPSDQPGGLFSVFRPNGNFLPVIEQAMASQAVKVMFRRQGGTLDVPVDLDLSVVETTQQLERRRGSQELLAFANCLPQLAR